MKEYKYKINGTTYNVCVGDPDADTVQVEVNGTPYQVELPKKPAAPVFAPKTTAPAAPRTQTGEKIVAKPVVPQSGYTVKAPLPGTVMSIAVKVGDAVKAADTVLTLEAMKMENAIHAERDGRVTAIAVAPGDSVQEGAPLITIE